MKTLNEIRTAIEAEPARSAWDKGKKLYALDLIDSLDDAIKAGFFDPANVTDCTALKAQMLGGAGDWSQYSWGGNALVYNWDIAERLCTPSEYKRSREGERKPNNCEEWVDVQARALQQAADMILRLVRA